MYTYLYTYDTINCGLIPVPMLCLATCAYWFDWYLIWYHNLIVRVTNLRFIVDCVNSYLDFGYLNKYMCNWTSIVQWWGECNVFERPFVFVDFNIIFEQAGTLWEMSPLCNKSYNLTTSNTYDAIACSMQLFG